MRSSSRARLTSFEASAKTGLPVDRPGRSPPAPRCGSATVRTCEPRADPRSARVASEGVTAFTGPATVGRHGCRGRKLVCQCSGSNRKPRSAISPPTAVQNGHSARAAPHRARVPPGIRPAAEVRVALADADDLGLQVEQERQQRRAGERGADDVEEALRGWHARTCRRTQAATRSVRRMNSSTRSPSSSERCLRQVCVES